MGWRRPLAAAVVVAIAGGSALTAASALADPAGSLVIPLQNYFQPRAANVVGAGTDGFAYVPQADDFTFPNIVWQPYDGSTASRVPFPGGMDVTEVKVVGDSIVYRTGPQ